MKKRKIKICVVVIFIATSLLTINLDYPHLTNETKEEKIIEKYIENKNTTIKKDNSFIAVLKIPKINLTKGIININSKDNNVNKNIETIKYIPPNKNNSIIVLAAHSGNSKVSYFKDINSLQEKDLLYLYTDKEIYVYEITQKYQIEKTGKITINDIKKQLILTTCNMAKKNKQLIIISIQIQKYLL